MDQDGQNAGMLLARLNHISGSLTLASKIGLDIFQRFGELGLKPVGAVRFDHHLGRATARLLADVHGNHARAIAVGRRANHDHISEIHVLGHKRCHWRVALHGDHHSNRLLVAVLAAIGERIHVRAVFGHKRATDEPLVNPATALHVLHLQQAAIKEHRLPDLHVGRKVLEAISRASVIRSQRNEKAVLELYRVFNVHLKQRVAELIDKPRARVAQATRTREFVFLAVSAMNFVQFSIELFHSILHKAGIRLDEHTIRAKIDDLALVRFTLVRGLHVEQAERIARNVEGVEVILGLHERSVRVASSKIQCNELQ